MTPSEHAYFEEVLQRLQQQERFVAVTLVDIVGSAPQNAGARMLVNAAGRCWGTIGGGKIEQHCIQTAQQMLQATTGPNTAFYEWNLQTEIGMTCGGLGRFYFERYQTQPWHIVVFGAGHVAQALIPVLLTLHCQVHCFDSRAEWIQALPVATNLQAQCVSSLAEQVAHLPPQSFVVSMTMGHAHDVPILSEIFRRQQQNSEAFPFVGVIGSPAKAGAIKRDLLKAGLPPESVDHLICPLGLPLGSNEPAEIAISISAQLLQERDRIFQTHQKWQKAVYRKMGS